MQNLVSHEGAFFYRQKLPEVDFVQSLRSFILLIGRNIVCNTIYEVK